MVRHRTYETNLIESIRSAMERLYTRNNEGILPTPLTPYLYNSLIWFKYIDGSLFRSFHRTQILVMSWYQDILQKKIPQDI